MTSPMLGTYQGHAVVEDRGMGLIPTNLLRRLVLVARKESHQRAGFQVLGRSYALDTLTAAVAAIDDGTAVELAPCSLCHDAPATEGDWCAPCCSGAQGSQHDDREKD